MMVQLASKSRASLNSSQVQRKRFVRRCRSALWIPAFAGMTNLRTSNPTQTHRAEGLPLRDTSRATFDVSRVLRRPRS